MPFPDSETITIHNVPFNIPRPGEAFSLRGHIEFAPYQYPLEDGRRKATPVFANGARSVSESEQAIIERLCDQAWDNADRNVAQRRIMQGRTS
jgi:hypothetical protein